MSNKTPCLNTQDKIIQDSLVFVNKLPSVQKLLAVAKGKQALVFCDKRFKNSAFLKKWQENPKLSFYYLNSGEKSKSLEQLPLHIKKINSLIHDFDQNAIFFVALGGGTLLDLTGFLASIYKRAVPFVAIPSTWLSALDSAHGGKNAINFKTIKNLLGTYHFPQAVFIVKELLKTNPSSLEQSAYGELLKIALIEGSLLYQQIKKESLKQQNRDINLFVKPAIVAKIKIVKQDPFEKKSLRKKLNLGHTVGHILEAHQSLAHGQAVLHGILFSLNWSFRKKFIDKKNFQEIKKLICLNSQIKKIPLKKFEQLLKQDKKHKLGHKIDFIFIKKPGQVFIKPVLEKQLIQEAYKQHLIKNA